jgi:hypothetical protein
MKKLREIRQEMQDLENLINQMKSEIDLYRNLAYRYFLKYGKELDYKPLEVPDNAEARLDIIDRNKTIECEFVNIERLGIKTRYKQITDKINELND